MHFTAFPISQSGSPWPGTDGHSEPQAIPLMRASTMAAVWSLCAHLAGVQPPLLSIPVHPLEVLEAWGTAEPGIAKMHVASEEELPAPRSHATFQQCGDASPPAAALRGGPEDPTLLPVEPVHMQVDSRLLLLRFVGDILDGASDHCRGKGTGVSPASKQPMSMQEATGG